MAVLVFLARAARARIVPSNPLLHMDRGVRLLLPVSDKVIATGLHLAHVGTAPRRLGRTGLILVSQRHEGPQEE